MDEIKLGGAGEIADREHAAQRLFEARDIAGCRVGAQELLIGFALNLDEVGHFHRFVDVAEQLRSEEHTSALQSLMRILYAVFCLKKKKHSAVHPMLVYHSTTK